MRHIGKKAFQLEKLPTELHFMIMSNMVLELAMVPSLDLMTCIDTAVTAPRKVMQAAGVQMQIATVSTSYRYVSLADPVFLISRAIRVEALKLSWSMDTCARMISEPVSRYYYYPTFIAY